MKINYKSVFKWTIILVFDYAVVVVLSLLLMGYDDFYDESKSEYFSLASMTTFQKGVFIFLNFWLFLNFLFLVKILLSGWKKLKKSRL